MARLFIGRPLDVTLSAGTEGADDDYELAGIASVSRGFDAGNPRGTKGRLPSPVLATA